MSRPNISPADRAAAWSARLEVSALTPVEARELQDWLDQDPAHEALLAQFTLLQDAARAELSAMKELGLLRDEPSVGTRPRHWRVWGVGLAAAAALVLAAIWWVRLPQAIATPAGKRQDVTLADGSHVALNARTTLAVHLRGGQRRVRLDQGEAYFEVAKDPDRPFFVETSAGVVRVTGTHFNVRSESAEALEVTVLEGSVAVQAGGTDRALAANDQLDYHGIAPEVHALDPTAAAEVIAWREGRVICTSVPLRVVLGRYARYHDVQIEVDARVETLPVGGIFNLDDLDGFLRDVRATLPVHILREPTGRRIRVLPK